MKIREIISETPVDAAGQAAGSGVGAAARGIGTAIGAVAGAPKAIVKGVAKGAAAWDKLMSPSKWFGGSDKADTDNKNTKNKTNDTTVAQYTDSLNAVAQGLNPNAKDIAHLKQLAAKQGFSPEEQEVLKAAYFGHQLDTQQRTIIKQITAKL
jgi:hypothetical protein